MKTLQSDKKISVIATDALLLCAALVLSYVEAVLPLDFIALPGFKPGLANIVITVAAFRFSALHAAVISLARVSIVFLLFGNPISFLFSLFGAVLVIVCLLVLTKHCSALSFVGVSLICASAHNLGQFVASLLLVGPSVTAYLPILLIGAMIFGGINGTVLCLLPDKIYNFSQKEPL